MKTRSRLLAMMVLHTLIAALLVAVLEASAQPRDVVDRFPTPRQVIADFGDDPSRRMALMVLYRALEELTPVPRSPAASARLTDYFRTVNQIDARYTRRGASASSRNAYYRRVGHLRNDAAFARAVLERYRLLGLLAGRPGGMRLGFGVRRPNAAAAVAAGLPWAAPYWLVTLVAIGLVPLGFALLFDGRGGARGTSSEESDPFQLPLKLRTITVLGRRLTFDLASGLVTRTETVGAGERVWMRTTDGYEGNWGFGTGVFPAQQGQILSLIASGEHAPDNPRVLIGYNHATHQLAAFAPMVDALRPRGRLPWLATTAVGVVGMWLGFASIAYRLAPEVQSDINWTGPLIVGALVTALAAWASVRVTARIVLKRRAALVEALGTSLGLFFPVLTPLLEEFFEIFEAQST